MAASPALRFYERVKSLQIRETELPDFFVYHITSELGESSATVKFVKECYRNCDLVLPSWLASHFSNGLKKPQKFLRTNDGYRLENKRRVAIEDQLGNRALDTETHSALIRLESRLPDGPKKEFLKETINCFQVSAFRAATVMCWSLAIHHLQEHILADQSRHNAFDNALSKSTDTRVKIKSITKHDDFTEMSESKFILFCREAKIISTSIYNKLEAKLDDRNSAAHPSGVTSTQKMTEAYIEDLVENILVKYSV